MTVYQIQYRENDKVKPLHCPVCGSEIIYDRSYSDLACIGKLKDKCVFGLSIADQSDDKYWLYSIRGTKHKTDYIKLGELLKEIEKRRRTATNGYRVYLANNVVATSTRGISVIDREDLSDYLRDKKLAREDFDYIRKCRKPLGEIIKLYDLRKAEIKEIQRLEVR